MSSNRSNLNLFQTLPMFAILFSCASYTVHAQDSAVVPISTERPAIGASADIIPAGSLQIESGLGASIQRAQYVADLPENMVRLGVTRRVELRFVSSNVVAPHSNAAGFSSLQTQDPGLSVKALLGGSNQWVPRSGILALSFPTGDPAQTSGSYDPTLAIIWQQTFTHGFSVTEVAQATLTTFHTARRGLWAPAFGFAKTLSTKYSVFGEYAFADLPIHTLTSTVDGGLLYAPSAFQQIDSRIGFVHDTSGFRTLLSLGYSCRFDHLLGLGRSLPAQR